jgi:hypothetical protein
MGAPSSWVTEFADLVNRELLQSLIDPFRPVLEETQIIMPLESWFRDFAAMIDREQHKSQITVFRPLSNRLE